MLRLLKIRDFQRHELLSIKLDPGVTTIVGPSDAGKSAILRALKWLSLNKPRGESFVRSGASRASVLVRAERRKISRTKGSSNTYRLDGKKYQAFGAEVPKEIAEVLNLSEVNFQGQHDPPFWLSDSPAEVSRKLNEIVDLSIIDTTLSNLSSGLRKKKAEREVLEKRLEEAREKIRENKPAKEADADLKALEALEAKLETGRKRRSLLRGILAEADKATATLQTLQEGLQAAEGVLALGKTWQRLQTKQNALLARMELGREVKAGPPSADLEPVEETLSALLRVAKKRTRLGALLTESSQVVDNEGKLRESADAAEAELQEAMGDRCALCGRSSKKS